MVEIVEKDFNSRLVNSNQVSGETFFDDNFSLITSIKLENFNVSGLLELKLICKAPKEIFYMDGKYLLDNEFLITRQSDTNFSPGQINITWNSHDKVINILAGNFDLTTISYSCVWTVLP